MTTPIHSPGRTQNRRRSPGAYTLIELLVTITIIAVLAVVAFSAFSNVRQKARISLAMAALRQVGSFQTLYAAENFGRINTMGGNQVGEPEKMHFWGRYFPYFMEEFPAGLDESGKIAQYQTAINKMLGSTDANTMAGTAFQGVFVQKDVAQLPVPFSFNSNLIITDQDKLRKMSEFPDTAQTLHIIYGRDTFSSADGSKYDPMPTDGGKGNNPIYYLSNKTAIAAFLDGHVEAISPPFDARHYGPTPAATP